MKSFFIATYIFCSSFLRHDFHLPKHNFRPTPRPTIVATPRHTHAPKPTKSPKPTFVPTATPTVSPKVEIANVKVHSCTNGSSCYSYITGVEVSGKNFSENTRMKLVNDINEFSGTLMGLTETKIITDFANLPHCKTFDVFVYGSTGTATSFGSVSSLCP